MTDEIRRLRDAFEAFIIAEVKRHDGIPPLTAEDMALREAIAALLAAEPRPTNPPDGRRHP